MEACCTTPQSLFFQFKPTTCSSSSSSLSLLKSSHCCNSSMKLTCGEFFDEVRNKWELIPDTLKDDPVHSSHSPPLLDVVNNELYSLEASSNQLKVYLKKSNTWKQMGPDPVRADCNRGWGVALKSFGK